MLSHQFAFYDFRVRKKYGPKEYTLTDLVDVWYKPIRYSLAVAVPSSSILVLARFAVLPLSPDEEKNEEQRIEVWKYAVKTCKINGKIN